MRTKIPRLSPLVAYDIVKTSFFEPPLLPQMAPTCLIADLNFFICSIVFRRETAVQVMHVRLASDRSSCRWVLEVFWLANSNFRRHTGHWTGYPLLFNLGTYLSHVSLFDG